MKASGTAGRFGRMAVKGALGTASCICLMLALVADPGVAQMRAVEGSVRAAIVPPLADEPPDLGEDGRVGAPAEN